MVEFKSSLGNKSFAGQQLREFDVPDESEVDSEYSNSPVRRGRPSDESLDMTSIRDFQNKIDHNQYKDDADIEREMRHARELKRSGKERLNDGAKRRVEMLVGMTQATREFTIGDNVFILQTLQSKSMREALMAASVYDGTIESPFEIRKQLLARSLNQIAGVPAEQFVGSNSIDAKLNFIDEQVEAVLNRLYGEYLILVKESDELYSIKTAEDAKEVVDAVKK